MKIQSWIIALIVKAIIDGTTKEKIIALIRNNTSITREVIADSLKITPRGVDYHITKMQNEGMLKREGSRKTGKWKLLK